MPNIEAKINSNLLKWARESFNKSKSEVASRLKVSEEFIDKIENGDAKVSIPQLRDLANVYKRPLAAFFFQKFLRIKLLDTFSKPKDMWMTMHISFTLTLQANRPKIPPNEKWRTSLWPTLKQEWTSGKLLIKWKREYPDLFDEEDLRIALSQPQFHFYEWIAALHYFGLGFNVLIEQYIYQPHKRKLGLLEKLIGTEGINFLRSQIKTNRTQPPDLFVYKDKKFFFVEVKGPRDKLQENQKGFFSGIEKYFKTEIVLLTLVPIS